tara:strand:+ start:307 stop:966 length:660 start_codon:yes stop_codon:yes gene_type:complete
MEVTIPTSWNDITIEMYIKLKPVLETEQEPVTKIINTLCILTDKKREDVENITLPDYKLLLKKMSFLNTELPKEIKKKRIKLNNQWYEWKWDAKNMLFGEYISIMEIMQKASENDAILFDNLHKILTVIFRPIDKKYGLLWKSKKMNGKVIRETADNILKNMSIADAYPIAVFFCNRYPDLMQTIKTSLTEEAEKIVTEVKKELKTETDLQTVGDGGRL